MDLVKRISMSTNFQRVARHVGWGDPKGHGLWFVGIEETLEWRQEHVDRLPEPKGKEGTYTRVDPDESDPRAAERTWTRIPEWESKIACKVSRDATEKRMSWSAYRDKCLWLDGSGIFSANLLPLGKKRTNHWPDEYGKLFGFGPDDWQAYQAEVRAVRYPALREFWELHEPAATIAFGKKRWPEFQTVFNLGQATGASADGRLLYYADERVVLTPFFGYWHMRDQYVTEICEQLRSWNVRIA
jgi:hypothetical protein